MSSFSVSYFPITTEAYHKMYEAGIISENEHVELIRGKIIRKRPKGSKHNNTVNRISDAFYKWIRPIAAVRGE